MGTVVGFEVFPYFIPEISLPLILLISLYNYLVYSCNLLYTLSAKIHFSHDDQDQSTQVSHCASFLRSPSPPDPSRRQPVWRHIGCSHKKSIAFKLPASLRRRVSKLVHRSDWPVWIDLGPKALTCISSLRHQRVLGGGSREQQV